MISSDGARHISVERELESIRVESQYTDELLAGSQNNKITYYSWEEAAGFLDAMKKRRDLDVHGMVISFIVERREV